MYQVIRVIVSVTVLGFLLTGCAGENKSPKVLDSHGDQHLWYSIQETDSPGIVRWMARMTASDKVECSAATRKVYQHQYRDCGISETQGQAGNVVEALKTIDEHYRLFVENNKLKVRD